ncbi:MAG: N-(5'-phosphoribosyl)anthranilate isomerase [Phycisphaerae bacterium]|nr:N-(5'-phosphoribosyl)anthranilate isomerase [Phycisphaerae bacterium]
MRVKICGIMRVEDMKAACVTGADFVGLNFSPGSPRYVGAEKVSDTFSGPAGQLLAAVEPPAIAVAVTVNAPGDLLDALAARFQVLQLHGDETPEQADAVIDRGVKIVKAFNVATEAFAADVAAWLNAVQNRDGVLAVLLDAAREEAGNLKFGGTGRRFNWDWLAAAREQGQLAGWPPILLAGGLTPKNVGTAIQTTAPWGVDAAGGVEVEDSPGVKSIDKIRDFIRVARAGR